MLESVSGANQYYARRVKFLAQGNNGILWWGFLLTTDRIRVRRATHCETVPQQYFYS